jgi:hypothetical protein
VRKRAWILTVAAGLLMCLTTATPVSACPMCKLANESDSRLPTAYMYSILFMLGMPATVLSGFGIGFWRLSRQAARMHREAAEQAIAGASDPIVSATQDTEPGLSAKGPTLPETGIGGLVFP